MPSHESSESDVLLRRIVLIGGIVSLIIGGLVFSRAADPWLHVAHHYHWSQQLRDPDYAVRRQALRRIRAQSDSCTGELISLMQSEDPSIRSFAAVELSREMPMSDRALYALRKSLRDPDPTVRSSGAYAIGMLARRHLNQPNPAVMSVLSDLASAAQDVNLTVRTQAIDAIGEYEALATPLMDLLLGFLDDQDDLIRVHTAHTIARINPDQAPEFVQVFSDVLQGDNSPARIRALDEIRDLGPQGSPALPAMVSILRDPQDELRGQAATAVGRLGDKASTALPSLISALDDSDASVLDRVVDALGELGPLAQPAVPALRDLGKRRPEMFAEIREAIQQIDPMGVPVTMMTT